MSTQTDTMPEPEQVGGRRPARRRMPSAGADLDALAEKLMAPGP